MPSRTTRRGAIVVIFGILLVTLLGAAGISLDISRVWAMRNELQTSADAGSLAGAIQLEPPNDPTHAVDSATSYARRNQVLGVFPDVDSVVLGIWADDGGGFTSGGLPTNAVATYVSHTTNGLIMSLFGVVAPRVHANAIAWADAPVATTGCIKPWAIPYVSLMARINTHRGITNTWDNMNRDFETPADLNALKEMSATSRTFDLKLGPGQISDTSNTVMPGNYQAVELPKYYDAASDSYPPDGGEGGGAEDYQSNVSGATCHTIGVGDSLNTLGSGDEMRGPTVLGANAGDGVGPGPCSQILGHIPYDRTAKTSASYGDCVNAEGTAGVEIKAVFYRCPTHCNGSTKVEVSMLGSFSLRKVYPENDDGGVKRFYQAQIVGEFTPVMDPGAIGSGPSTLRRIILVR